jgi:hypothetical protein
MAIKFRAMMKFIAVLSLVLSMSSAQALELKKLESSDVADANFCGDINSATLYEITSLEANERDSYTPDNFVLTARAVEKIRAALTLASGDSAKLVVTASYENAKNQLQNSLGSLEGESLSSCQPASVLSWFGLERGQSVSLGGYFVLGELSPNGLWADEFRHHIVVDLKRMRLATFLIW